MPLYVIYECIYCITFNLESNYKGIMYRGLVINVDNYFKNSNGKHVPQQTLSSIFYYHLSDGVFKLIEISQYGIGVLTKRVFTLVAVVVVVVAKSTAGLCWAAA
jgi:hypothetical protein